MKMRTTLPDFSKPKVSTETILSFQRVTNLHFPSAFNEFISEREYTPPAPTSSSSTSVHTSITLFDSIILSKKNRGRLLPTARQLPGLSLTSKNPFSSRFSTAMFSQSSTAPDFLNDTSDHVWRTTAAPHASSGMRSDLGDPGRDYRQIVTRVPGKLEEKLMRGPRPIQNASKGSNVILGNQKPLPANLRERMNGLALNAPDLQPPLPSNPTGMNRLR